MTINQQILAWARPKLNTRVGDGECWTYVENAITQAGGISSRTLTPDFDEDSNYVWGDAVALTSLQVGDLLQFRNYRWDHNTEVKIIFADGTWQTLPTGTQTRPHHSAIVNNVLGAGRVEVLEQNIPEGTGVIKSELQLSSAQAPKRTTQEQRRHPTSGRMEQATVETTINERVNGQIWGYRAKTP